MVKLIEQEHIGVRKNQIVNILIKNPGIALDEITQIYIKQEHNTTVDKIPYSDYKNWLNKIRYYLYRLVKEKSSNSKKSLRSVDHTLKNYGVRMKFDKFNIFKKAWTAPAQPNIATHIINDNVIIKKGETEGKIHIPVPCNLLGYTIDMNPSLLKRGKIAGNYHRVQIPLNEKFIFHDDEKLELRDGDEEMTCEEVSKCPHCGQKVTISQVSAIEHKSDPEFTVRLSDAATENLSIPVKFGFDIGHLRAVVGVQGLFAALIGWVTLYLFATTYAWNTFQFGNIILGFIGLLMTIFMASSSYRGLSWYLKNKSKITRLKK